MRRGQNINFSMANAPRLGFPLYRPQTPRSCAALGKPLVPDRRDERWTSADRRPPRSYNSTQVIGGGEYGSNEREFARRDARRPLECRWRGGRGKRIDGAIERFRPSIAGARQAPRPRIALAKVVRLDPLLCADALQGCSTRRPLGRSVQSNRGSSGIGRSDSGGSRSTVQPPNLPTMPTPPRTRRR